MIIRFLEVAQQELDEAVLFHETQTHGLGQVFLAEVLADLDLMRRHPAGRQPLSINTRRCRLRRFPYGIIYLADQAEILIVAVFHLHRRPDYWRKRIQADMT